MQIKLNGLLRDQVFGAFKLLGDVKSFVTYTKIDTSAYNPTTDTYAETTTDYTFYGVLARMTTEEQNSFEANKITQKLLVPAAAIAIIPNVKDYVTIAGTRWAIKRVGGVPGGSLHILYLQEP